MLTTPKLNKINRGIVAYYARRNIAHSLFASSLVCMMATPVLAQETPSADTSNDDRVEVIEVSGLRGTITRSLNEKKNNTSIVDAIAAADFGELPGLSLSDIIENIAGASGHRLKGSQNEISIRGLGSYWGYSTFNGRTITNAGPGRAVNFKKFPSDLVDKVVIYKSQQANLVEGGTSGTIDVTSLRPIDYGKSLTTVEASGIYNSYYNDVDGGDTNPWGSKFVISTVRQWETDDFGAMGFSLGYVDNNDSNPEENYGGSSQMRVCALRGADGSVLDGENGDLVKGGRDCDDTAQGVSAGRQGSSPIIGNHTDLADFDESSVFYVPSNLYWRTGEDTDDRENVVATFQWQPNDEWDINFDFEYSHLFYEEKRMELGLSNNLENLTNHVIGDDHTLLYVEGRTEAQLNGENRTQKDVYKGGGFNVAYLPNDDLTIEADFSYSESYRYRLRHRSQMRSKDFHDYSLDRRDTNVGTLTFTDGFDPSDMSNFVNDNGVARLDYRRTHEERNDDIWAFKLDGEYALEHDIFSSLTAGFRYSEESLYDEQTTDNSITFEGVQRNGNTDTDDNSWGNNNPETHAALTASIVNNCGNDHNNSGLFDEENAGSASNFATYDTKCFIGEILNIIPSSQGNGFYDIGERPDLRDGADRYVDEDIFSAYVMANIDTEIGNVGVTGNLGLRMVQTTTHSDGFGDKAYVTTEDDGTFSTTTVSPNGDSISELTLDSKYTEWLPSLNLSFAVTDEFIVRTAAYQAISRFQLNAMSAGVSLNTCGVDNDDCNTDFNQAVLSSSASGNHLQPYRSDNYDLSLEYYPSEDAAVTLAFYWKDFTGGYVSTTELRDIVVSLDGVDTVIPNVGTTVNQTADESSTIKGYEFTAQKAFTELPAPFDGLGASVAYNHAISDFVSPEVGSPGIVPDANLFGFSKDVASASVYWEGDDVTLRLLFKHRSKYFQPNNLPFPSRSHRYVQEQNYVDFSAKYKISKKVSVSFKALNLLNEPQVMTRGNDTTVSDYSRTGAKFNLGIKAKF
ncbi:TonB-dependent receptor [Paraglaciecola aquimarina]|uniref:TonB-dependent receptor n=1 Tax=Paraglaciecola aquimarina TaxID=1235557 RepID=A0ABU3SV79_9ALTE|nr:TonB-dependent receptor [Paraglaciecola aquimarina]MDU0353899.1 TonB-dependent receptor [Paraglaciecola aquimarina]